MESELDSINAQGNKLPPGTQVKTEKLYGEDFTTVYYESPEGEFINGIWVPNYSYGSTNRNPEEAKANVLKGLQARGLDISTGTFLESM